MEAFSHLHVTHMHFTCLFHCTAMHSYAQLTAVKNLHSGDRLVGNDQATDAGLQIGGGGTATQEVPGPLARHGAPLLKHVETSEKNPKKATKKRTFCEFTQQFTQGRRQEVGIFHAHAIFAFPEGPLKRCRNGTDAEK